MNSCAFFAVLLLYLLSCVHAWGTEGHGVVATIAQRRLTASTQQQVKQFISEKTFESICMIPDSYKSYAQGKWSSECHYVNVQQGATEVSMSDCLDRCVIKSVQNYTKILFSEIPLPRMCSFLAGDEPCALDFLIHFVGDIHQPMHAGYASDRGGNDVQLTFFGKSMNLHALWDYGILDKWDGQLNSVVQKLETMMLADPALVEHYESNLDPLSWANESFHYVKTLCYDFGSDSKVPALGEEYYNRALPVVQQRLIAAGVRLAKILNVLFDKAARK